MIHTIPAARGRPPVIGLIAHQIQVPSLHKVGTTRRIDGQYGDYCRSLTLAGAAPLLIPLDLDESAWRVIYERLDGLLLPGGVDVAPVQYAQSPHPKLGKVVKSLDDLELTLARWALQDGLPLFGICRGIQVLNVAAGGTLYQDIPSQLPDALPHSCPDQFLAHSVRVQSGTCLANALGTTDCAVNSRHHQSILEVAPGFVVTAHALDGVIEGIEKPGDSYAVAVQWHPENMAPTDPLMLRLFQALVDASRV